MSMKELRKRYKVPAKRGMEVRCGKKGYTITSARRASYIGARDSLGKVMIFHPFDLDYVVKGPGQSQIVVRGAELKAAYDARWDEFNRQMNEYLKRTKAERIPTQQEVDEAFGL